MKRELYAILLLSEVDEMPILPLIRGKIILRRYTEVYVREGDLTLFPF